MLSYCLKCRKNVESEKTRFQRQIKENKCFYQRIKCFKKSRSVKEQEANGLLTHFSPVSHFYTP